MLKCEHHQIHCLVQVHQKAGHIGIRNGDGVAGFDLIDEQRDDAAAGTHHIAIAGTADGRAAALRRHARVGVNHVLHHGL